VKAVERLNLEFWDFDFDWGARTKLPSAFWARLGYIDRNDGTESNQLIHFTD
jgi:hypothetical protein